MARKHHQIAPSPRTEIGERLFETGRWQSCALKIHGGGCLFHVVSVYGFPGANEGGEEMEQNEALIQDVFLEAMTLGDVPIIIGGDFNTKLENSPFLTEMMSSGTWNDAASLFAAATDTMEEDTYQTAMGSSRIDMLFMNAAATRIFKRCNVVAVPPRVSKGTDLLKRVGRSISQESLRIGSVLCEDCQRRKQTQVQKNSNYYCMKLCPRTSIGFTELTFKMR